MPELDMSRVWTPLEIRGSLYVLDWLRAEIMDPDEHQPTVEISHVLTPWELRDDDATACELIRHYSRRLN